MIVIVCEIIVICACFVNFKNILLKYFKSSLNYLPTTNTYSTAEAVSVKSKFSIPKKTKFIVKNKTLKFSEEISEGQSNKEPKGQKRRTQGLKLRIAGEHAVASVPLERKLDGAGEHVPATAAPVHAHRVHHPVDVANVKNVRVVVDDERARLAMRLFLHERGDLGEVRLDLGLATEFPEDRGVQ